MSQRGDEIKAGIMVLVGIVLFGAFVVATIGIGTFGQETDGYSALVGFSGGIKPGTDVRFGGLKVGQVEGVQISETHPTQLEIRIRVARGIPVRTDSVMHISQLGMLSDYYIEITTGSPDAPLATPGSRLAGKAPVDLNAVFAQVEGIAEQLETTLRTVNEEILRKDRLDELRKRIRGILDQVSTLLADLDAVVNEENRTNIAAALESMRGILEDNRPDLRTTMVNVREASERMRVVLEEAQGLVADARPEVQQILEDLGDTIEEAERLMQNLDATVTENRPAIGEMVDNLNATSANARDLTETLSQEPWRLVWPPEEQKPPSRRRRGRRRR